MDGSAPDPVSDRLNMGPVEVRVILPLWSTLGPSKMHRQKMNFGEMAAENTSLLPRLKC